MADSKITALTAISTVDPTADPLVIVDVSDTSMAASGTTKKSTINQLLGAGGTATLASATITGDLTVDTSTLKVDSTNNRVIVGHTSGSSAFQVTNAGAAGLEIQPTGFSSAPLILSYNRSGSAYTQLTLDGSTIVHALSGTTAMTLNSTGLGIGASPTQKLSVNGAIDFKAYVSHMDNFAVYAHSSDGTILSSFTGYPICFRVANSEKARIDTSGNVGIGVTPSAWTNQFIAIEGGDSNNQSAVSFQTNANAVNLHSNSYYSTGYKYKFTGTAGQYALGGNQHEWYIAPSGTAGDAITFTQAMTLDASGNLFIGKTATGLGTVGIQESPLGWLQATVSGDASLFTNRLASDGKTVQFYRQTLEVGNISVTTTGATFNSTSDYRLKEAVAPLSGGLARVNALKPSVYKWKSNGSTGEGFLAHELADVVPSAVNGEKDAVNEDGSINAQSIDMSRVVPILVAAIQELTAEVNALKNA